MSVAAGAAGSARDGRVPHAARQAGLRRAVRHQRDEPAGAGRAGPRVGRRHRRRLHSRAGLRDYHGEFDGFMTCLCCVGCAEMGGVAIFGSQRESVL